MDFKLTNGETIYVIRTAAEVDGLVVWETSDQVIGLLDAVDAYKSAKETHDAVEIWQGTLSWTPVNFE